MTRKRFCYYNENDFKDLKDKSKEELIDKVKDTYINHLNYWMESLEGYMELLDESNQMMDKFNQRIDKAIEYIETNKLNSNKISEMLCGSEVLKLLEILRGELND